MEDKIRKVIREQIKKLKEGMSDKEWADAKEAERLAKHPEKDKIMKIKQMIDKEKQDWTPEDHEEEEEWQRGWKHESLKEAASELGYLDKQINRPEEDDFKDLGEEFDETKFEEFIKASFVYTEQEPRQFYFFSTIINHRHFVHNI